MTLSDDIQEIDKAIGCLNERLIKIENDISTQSHSRLSHGDIIIRTLCLLVSFGVADLTLYMVMMVPNLADFKSNLLNNLTIAIPAIFSWLSCMILFRYAMREDE